MRQKKSVSFNTVLGIELLALLALAGIFVVIAVQARSNLEDLAKTSSFQILKARTGTINEIVNSYQKLLNAQSRQDVFISGTEREAEEAAYAQVGKVGDDISTVFLIWSDGRATVSPGNYINTADRPYVRAVYSGEQDTAISDPLLSRKTGRPALIMAHAVKTSEGKIRALLAIEITLAKLDALVDEISLGAGESSYAWVADKNGLIFSSGFPGLSMKVNIAKADDEAGYKGLSALSSDILGQKRASGTFVNPAGVEYTLFTEEISEQTQWRLGIATSTEFLMHPFHNLVLVLAGIMVTALVASLTAAVHVGKLHAVRNDLIRAREEAVASANAKGSFLANMSHEIRTPLNAVVGMTTLGKKASDPARKDYCFSKIEDASNHLLGVINDILDISKIEANKLELSPKNFDFEKMIQRVLNVVNFRVEEKRLNFLFRQDKAIPRALLGDDQRLAQIIANLLSNAIKFTPELGTVHLNARLLREEAEILTLQFEVTDTGIGLSPEQQAKLFTSFQQAESDTSRKFGGTGLGLAISKRIVELMGGRIWVNSEPGRGSTFAFTVRLERGAVEYHNLLSPDVNWGNVRVLAVDDAPEVREYFLETAAQLQISCDVAANGEEALRMSAQAGAYDIYFMDWKMPGMDGIETAARLREANAGKSVVIMISSADLNQVETDAQKSGVGHFLSKPIFRSDIVDCLNQCLGRPRPDNKKDRQDGEPEERFAGYRILLAEDVEINREIALALLEPTGLAVDCAENGRQALEMLQAAPERYNAILMDVQMPEMDGYEATRKIRALDDARARSVPIIAMTANVFREDVEKCLAAGMDDHTGKPLDFEDVKKKLRKYLAARLAAG
ncbi:MAG: response regulator [Desulfovibrio sp.]|jgi:signal transduction histidine kinase/CheY-like chemotaxis protein|nr:response regulator [Desulfovibrio sp.]